jgi:hypothetical protein
MGNVRNGIGIGITPIREFIICLFQINNLRRKWIFFVPLAQSSGCPTDVEPDPRSYLSFKRLADETPNSL